MDSAPRKLRSVETVNESISAIAGDSNLFKTKQGMKAFAQVIIEIARGTLQSKPEVLKAMCFWDLNNSEPLLYRIFQRDSVSIAFLRFSLYPKGHEIRLAFNQRRSRSLTLGQILGLLLVESEETMINTPIALYVEDAIQHCWEMMQSKADYPLPKQVAVDRILKYGLRQAFSELERREE